MSRVLAEGMVGERKVTDAFAPKARVKAEPLDCKTPNTPSCLCVSAVNLEALLDIDDASEGFEKLLKCACGDHDGIPTPAYVFSNLQKPPSLVFFEIEKKNLAIDLNFLRRKRVVGAVLCIRVHHIPAMPAWPIHSSRLRVVDSSALLRAKNQYYVSIAPDFANSTQNLRKKFSKLVFIYTRRLMTRFQRNSARVKSSFLPRRVLALLLRQGSHRCSPDAPGVPPDVSSLERTFPR
jgi:hypothetical protein